MEEFKATIVQNGQYNNLVLKTKYKKNGKMFVFDSDGNKIVDVQGIPSGKDIVVSKKYIEGREVAGKFGLSFSCLVTYNGTECSFFLNQKEHDVYKTVGGIDDSVKISLVVEPYLNPVTGIKGEAERLYFEKVQ